MLHTKQVPCPDHTGNNAGLAWRAEKWHLSGECKRFEKDVSKRRGCTPDWKEQQIGQQSTTRSHQYRPGIKWKVKYKEKRTHT